MAVSNLSAARAGKKRGPYAPRRKVPPDQSKTHGGARPGAGRPLGSPEAPGRRKSKVVSEKDRVKAITQQLGQALKERDDYKRQVEDLRYSLNFGKHFPDDSKELLTAVYKNEYSVTQEQIYAAKTLLDREYPLPERGQYQVNEHGRVVLYLPDNGRDPPDGADIDDELEKLVEGLVDSAIRETLFQLAGRTASVAGRRRGSSRLSRTGSVSWRVSWGCVKPRIWRRIRDRLGTNLARRPAGLV
jgi:hypothetical protein